MNAAITYMEEKYGETFSLVGPWNGQFGKDYSMFELRSSQSPDERILVRRMKMEEREIYQDNYIAIILKSQIETRIKMMAEQTFGKCTVVYQIPELVFPEYFTADTSAEDVLKESASMVKVTICLQEWEENKEEQVKAFLYEVRKQGYILGGTISFLSGQEVIFSLDKDGNVRYLEWKEKYGRKGH